MSWDLTLGLIGLMFVVLIPICLWHIWRTGTVIETRAERIRERCDDIQRSADDLQRILNATRKSKGRRS